MKRLFLLSLSLLMGLALCACSSNQEIEERLSVSHSTAAEIEKNGDEDIIEITGEIDSLDSFDDLALALPKDEVPLLGEWIYRITFQPANFVKDSTEIVIQFGKNCLSINDRIYVSADEVSYTDILEWVESKYSYFSEN